MYIHSHSYSFVAILLFAVVVLRFRRPAIIGAACLAEALEGGGRGSPGQKPYTVYI